jgi:hypothetical protein
MPDFAKITAFSTERHTSECESVGSHQSLGIRRSTLARVGRDNAPRYHEADIGICA